MWDAWDSILADMLERPADVVVVSARRRGRGHGGWSKNNPYMEDVRTHIRFLCELSNLELRYSVTNLKTASQSINVALRGIQY